jgi:hypothetical protein
MPSKRAYGLKFFRRIPRGCSSEVRQYCLKGMPCIAESVFCFHRTVSARFWALERSPLQTDRSQFAVARCQTRLRSCVQLLPEVVPAIPQEGSLDVPEQKSLLPPLRNCFTGGSPLDLLLQYLLEISKRSRIVRLPEPENGVLAHRRIGVGLRHVQQFRHSLVFGQLA